VPESAGNVRVTDPVEGLTDRVSDECEGDMLREYYCMPDGSYSEEMHACDYECSNGICRPAPENPFADQQGDEPETPEPASTEQQSSDETQQPVQTETRRVRSVETLQRAVEPRPRTIQRTFRKRQEQSEEDEVQSVDRPPAQTLRQRRICDRVLRRYEHRIEAINRRLLKRFGFVCEAE
jgi:hypothetical protein